MRHLFLLILIPVLAGCATANTTPTGPLSEYDLRDDQPEDVRTSAPANSEAHTHTALLPVGPAGKAAQVELTWHTFEYAGGQYIASASFEVIESVRGLELEAAAGGSSMNVGTEAAPVQVMQFSVSWFERGRGSTPGGSLIGQIEGDGDISTTDDDLFAVPDVD